MYGKEIENFIQPYNNQHIFKGVYSADTLPSKNKFTLPAAFIVNLSNSSSAGSHWISIYISKYNIIGYYFDSYGFAPKINTIIKWLRNVYNKVIFNKYQIQHYKSRLCGFYSSVFVIFC